MENSPIQTISIDLIPSDDPLLEIFHGFISPGYTYFEVKKQLECAGKIFDACYQQKILSEAGLLNSAEQEENSPRNLEEDKDEKAFSGKWAQKAKKMTKEERAKQSLFKENYYEILGLEDIGINATETDIKSAYRKLATLYHPDKVQAENKQEEEKMEIKKEASKVNKEIWSQIQNAYEVLSSPTSRKQYDSSLPFDDTIPSDSEDINDGNFFEVYYFG